MVTLEQCPSAKGQRWDELWATQNRKAERKRSVLLPLGKLIMVYFYLCFLMFFYFGIYMKGGSFTDWAEMHNFLVAFAVVKEVLCSLPKSGGINSVRRYQSSWVVVCPVSWVREQGGQRTCAATALLTLMRIHVLSLFLLLFISHQGYGYIKRSGGERKS